ncbi:MAG: hypothetical protein FWG77_08345 [Treponema sp.]|nr:hypothetical protein [Treponema sp.]
MNRKTLFGILTLFFALFMFSCDGFDIPENDLPSEEPMFTADGTPMVTIDIDTGAINRALSEGLARGGINFYEVTFRFTSGTPAVTEYYRASWPADRQGRISIPVGEYDLPSTVFSAAQGAPTSNRSMAVLFAGREFAGTRSLLAVGVITELRDLANNPQSSALSTTAASIALDTRTIKFTLSPITNDIRLLREHNTFVVRGPTALAGVNYSTPSALPRLDVGGGAMRPVFDIPIGVPASTTTSTDSTTNLSVVYGLRVPYSNAVMMLVSSTTAEAGAGFFMSTGFSNGIDIGVVVPLGLPHRIDFTPAGAGGTPTFGTGIVQFTPDNSMIPSLLQTATVGGAVTPSGFMIPINTSAMTEPGLSMLRMNIPVRAIGGDTASPGITWYIQGGFNNLEFDAASGTGAGQSSNNDSLGGAILLGVGPYLSREFIIEHIWPTTP